MSQPFDIYGDMRSGNCRKVRWALEHVGADFVWHELDIMQGATRTPEFLSKNPNGRVPLLLTAQGDALAESNAIIWFLAESSEWVPEDAWARAQVLQWMCFEQYSHEPYIAVRRFIRQYLDWPNERISDYEAKEAGGYAALDVMENTLAHQDYLVGKRLTLADVALFAYTSVADEGGFDLSRYSGIKRWLARCEITLPLPAAA